MKESHKWIRNTLKLPRDAVEPLLHEQLLVEVKKERALLCKELEEPSSSSMDTWTSLQKSRPPSSRGASPPAAKFLSTACLPHVYAKRWQFMAVRRAARSAHPSKGQTAQAAPNQGPFKVPVLPALIVESPTRILVQTAEGEFVRVPARTWLLLEPPASASSRELSFGSLNRIPLAAAAGGGFIVQDGPSSATSSDDDGVVGASKSPSQEEGTKALAPGQTRLRMVLGHRLHSAAAEANFRRASVGTSVLALRHAALASALLAHIAPERQRTATNEDAAKQQPPSRFEDVLDALILAQPTPPPRRGAPYEPAGARPGSQPSEPGEGRSSRGTKADSACGRVGPPWAVHGLLPGLLETAKLKAAHMEKLVLRRAEAAKELAEITKTRQDTEEVILGLPSDMHKESNPHGKRRGFLAFQAFRAFVVYRFGSWAKAWWKLDPDANMKIGEAQFARQCAELGFKANLGALWNYLDRDGSGQVSVLEIDAGTAMALAAFKRVIDEGFASKVDNMFHAMDVNRSGRLNRKEFTQAVQALGYSDHLHTSVPISSKAAAGHLFDVLDRRGVGALGVLDLAWLSKWYPPPWIYCKPNPVALQRLKSYLVDKHQSPLRAWRRVLDKSGKMRLSWEGFCHACASLVAEASGGGAAQLNGTASAFVGTARKKGRALDIPTASGLPRSDMEVGELWRSLDPLCSGYILLRDFDRAAFEALAEFKRWCVRQHGGVIKALHVLDGGTNAKLSESELKRSSLGPDPCTADLVLLFDGLDVHENFFLTEHELQFLDHWELEWEDWERFVKERQQPVATLVTPRRSLDGSHPHALQSNTSHSKERS